MALIPSFWFTDTDSLCYEFTSAGANKDTRKNLDVYHTSDYPKNHPNYFIINSKIVGKFKEECNGLTALELDS